MNLSFQTSRANGKGVVGTFVSALLAACLGGFLCTARAQTNFQVIKILSGLSNPTALIEGTDGVLYGTVEVGGAPEGVVFKIKKDGSGWSVLHGFGGPKRD